MFDWEYRQEILTNPKYSCGKWGNFLLKKCTFFYPPYLKSIRSNSKLKLSDDLYVMKFGENKFDTYYCIVDKQEKILYRIGYSTLHKYEFLALGPHGKQLWELFKTACIKDITEQRDEIAQEKRTQELENLRIDALISQKLLSSRKPTQYNKSAEPPQPEGVDPILVERCTRFLNDPQLSSICKSNLKEIIQLVHSLDDPRLIQRCNSYYLPEIIDLLSLMKKSTNKIYKRNCDEILEEFKNRLKARCTMDEKASESQKAETMISTFRSMMKIDGLIPDMIQEELNKHS